MPRQGRLEGGIERLCKAPSPEGWHYYYYYYTLFLPKARCVCRQAACKGCQISLVGLARSTQDSINRGHVAQYLYRPPPAGAIEALRAGISG